MNEYDVRRLALVFAIQSEIEGMKADNKQRESCCESMAYVDSDFREKAEELRGIAYAHDQQLFG